MEGYCKMCEHCPIEKENDGACFDYNGTWTQDEQKNWIFDGTWKCNYYNKEIDNCEYSK